MPRAETKGSAAGLRTTVPVVPDAPVGHFVLDIFGGKVGYLVHTENICVKAPVIKAAFTAHSGRQLRPEGQGQAPLRQVQAQAQARSSAELSAMTVNSDAPRPSRGG